MLARLTSRAATLAVKAAASAKRRLKGSRRRKFPIMFGGGKPLVEDSRTRMALYPYMRIGERRTLQS